MKYLFVLIFTVFSIAETVGQCQYNAIITSSVNQLESKGKTTRLNLNGKIQILKDSIFIQQQVVGQSVRYKYKITETECSAWKESSKMGVLIFMVQEVGSDKPYEGKIILVKAKNNRVITLLDSIEGKYQINYEEAQIEEL